MAEFSLMSISTQTTRRQKSHDAMRALRYRTDKYFLEDQGSTNGTFVNRGRRLEPGQRHPLKDGDEIIVGKTFLRFHIAK